MHAMLKIAGAYKCSRTQPVSLDYIKQKIHCCDGITILTRKLSKLLR